MDLLGAALPNVMFVVGILALGLGLGIELKVVSLNKELDKTARMGALLVGILLVSTSVFMYLNPAIAKRDQDSTTNMSVAGTVPSSDQVTTAVTSAPAPTQVVEAAVATSAPAPTQVVEAAVATSAPAPQTAPAGEAVSMSAGSETALVTVPDLSGMQEKEIKRALEGVGLRMGEQQDTCEGQEPTTSDVKRGRVLCQSPAAGQAVAPGTAVHFVLVR